MHDNIMNRIPFWLVQVTTAVRKRFGDHLQPVGFKATEAVILKAISIHGSLPLTEVAKRMAFAHPSVLRHIDALEKRGLIERRPHADDRRIKLLCLTEVGEKVIPQISEVMDRLNQPAGVGLTQAEYDSLMSLLKKVHHHLEGEIPILKEMHDGFQKHHHNIMKKFHGDKE